MARPLGNEDHHETAVKDDIPRPIGYVGGNAPKLDCHQSVVPRDVQPFPDGNHRTGVAAAELLLQRGGIKFKPTVGAAKAFQVAVTSARFRLLRGYDDAPLAVLAMWDDEVMKVCLEFIRNASA